jgi:excisionase family DNA binding protein
MSKKVNHSSAGLYKDTNQHLQRTYGSKEVQEILNISKSTLDKMCHKRELSFHVHPQRRKRHFYESDLVAYQRECVRIHSKDELGLK